VLCRAEKRPGIGRTRIEPRSIFRRELVNSLGDIAGLAFADELSDWNTCHCNPWARLRLPLVTPSLARTVGDRNLQSAWRAAVEAQREAEEWFVIGYSMPSEDVAIRSLLCRAAGARMAPLAIHVIQHGMDAEPLYRALFPGCVYHPNGLASFLMGRADSRSPVPSDSRPPA
jgi:hypothetical protein